MSTCARCGADADESVLEYAEDGLICKSCAIEAEAATMASQGLVTDAKWGIVGIVVGLALLGAALWLFVMGREAAALGARAGPALRGTLLCGIGGAAALGAGAKNVFSVMKTRRRYQAES